eukprot:TRINITY_DN21160_c0_g1_i1.p2 TRINITY_DN21160_c0_g1~~TRINITY_DN21160_c0_g1_i1.p2  ORF type:complete len:357 (+),score=33.28 TRINITY_DN21160_c0_g1_i1:52-1122(+)
MTKNDTTKDLWQIIQSQQGTTATEQMDVNVLVVGNKGAGKTTLINKFRREDVPQPKPTTALEYSHSKREEGKMVKVAHFWELGGGTQLSSLLDVVITPETVHTLLVIIVADLSSPSSVWDSVYFWLTRIKKRVGECFLKMQQRGSTTPGRMIARMQKRFGEKHADTEKVTIIGIPMLVVCTKYDVFRKEASEFAKTMARTLRFMAHMYAACLIYLNNKDERDTAKFRALLNNLVFGAPITGNLQQVDHSNPIFVVTGKDTLKDIGPPQGANKPSGFQTCGSEEFDKWKAPFETVFPPAEAKEATAEKFNDKDPAYAEPRVDDMRSVKNGELDQYRQQRAKRAQEASKERERERAKH